MITTDVYILRQCWRNRTFHFFGGRGNKVHLHPPPQMSPAFWLYLRDEPRIFFEETKVSLTGEMFFFCEKTKMTKIFGFEIWKGLKKANFEQFWKSSFFVHDLLSFSRAIIFSHFCFFLKKLLLVSSGRRLLIKFFFYLK